MKEESKPIIRLLMETEVAVTTERDNSCQTVPTGKNVNKPIKTVHQGHPRGQGGCGVRNQGQYPLRRKCRKQGSDPLRRHRLCKHATKAETEMKRKGERQPKNLNILFFFYAAWMSHSGNL
jgi:hypothetical protein